MTETCVIYKFTDKEIEKEPNPTKEIRSPDFNAPVETSTNASSALFASAFDKLAAAAIASINSALFIINFFKRLIKTFNGTNISEYLTRKPVALEKSNKMLKKPYFC